VFLLYDMIWLGCSFRVAGLTFVYDTLGMDLVGGLGALRCFFVCILLFGLLFEVYWGVGGLFCMDYGLLGEIDGDGCVVIWQRPEF
jgi:hypothetical protein